jgi:hypothetical protein
MRGNTCIRTLPAWHSLNHHYYYSYKKLAPVLLGEIAVGKGLVVFGVVAVVPLAGAVLAEAEAGGGLALLVSRAHAEHGVEVGALVVQRLVAGVAGVVAGKVGGVGRGRLGITTESVRRLEQGRWGSRVAAAR